MVKLDLYSALSQSL